MSTETTALAKVDTKALTHAVRFSPEQEKMIRDTFLSGASPQDAEVMLEIARIRGLSPITKQIHFVKRMKWNADLQRKEAVWIPQVGIDGFRSLSERTGLYDGQDEPEFEYDSKGKILLCKVRVYRKDISRAFVGVAHFSEYVQTKADGQPNETWASKPHVMLAKCAEAMAHRKAFPETNGDLYAPEENAGEERESVAHPPPPARAAPPPLVATPELPAATPEAKTVTATVVKDTALDALMADAKALKSEAEVKPLGERITEARKANTITEADVKELRNAIKDSRARFAQAGQ